MTRTTTRPRGRRRSDGRGGYLFVALVYGLLLFLVNSWPGWESIPLVTPAAAALVWLLNLSLVMGALAQLVCAFDDARLLQAIGVYCVALVNTVLVGSLLQVFPFDLGDVDPAWATATRLVLAVLLVWVMVRAMRAAVRVAHGRQPVRLARGHA